MQTWIKTVTVILVKCDSLYFVVFTVNVLEDFTEAEA
jgi:hypothetical protein